MQTKWQTTMRIMNVKHHSNSLCKTLYACEIWWFRHLDWISQPLTSTFVVFPGIPTVHCSASWDCGGSQGGWSSPATILGNGDFPASYVLIFQMGTSKSYQLQCTVAINSKPGKKPVEGKVIGILLSTSVFWSSQVVGLGISEPSTVFRYPPGN